MCQDGWILGSLFFLPGYMDWGKLRSKNKKEWNQWLAILTKKAWSKRSCLPLFLLKLTLQGFLSNEHNIYFIFLSGEATTSCKNVETLQWKTSLSLLQIAASCTSVIYNTDRPSPPPSLPVHSKLFHQVWSCIASNFDKGRREGSQAQDHGQAI